MFCHPPQNFDISVRHTSTQIAFECLFIQIWKNVHIPPFNGTLFFRNGTECAKKAKQLRIFLRIGILRPSPRDMWEAKTIASFKGSVAC